MVISGQDCHYSHFTSPDSRFAPCWCICSQKGFHTGVTLFSRCFIPWMVSLSQMGPTDKSPDLFPTILFAPHMMNCFWFLERVCHFFPYLWIFTLALLCNLCDLPTFAFTSLTPNFSLYFTSLKEINPEYSLEGLMLKLTLQYFDHLMRRADSLERWEGLKVEGEGDDRGWDGWMASLTQWTWIWVCSGSWWWTGRPDVLWSMGSQRVGHDWVTELNCEHIYIYIFEFSNLINHRQTIRFWRNIDLCCHLW